MRLAVVGTGEARYEKFFTGLAEKYRGRAWFFGGYDDSLAHWIEGASDAFLMPSQYEPCGLNQMYSLRYGTVPIVRATGGLEDTVEDFDEATGRGTGFKFRDYTSDAMLHAIERALAVYRRPTRWQALRVAGMRKDYSWDASALEYVKLYDRLTHLVT